MAEILDVSGRTVSRWETGTNLPDLSILVQISEYYNVEIKEILNGERKSKNMDYELKETLLKVADYNELEKQRAARSGNISFCIMFLICVGIFSIVFYLLLRKHMTETQAIGIAICFFIVLSAISYALLRGLSHLSQRKSDKLKDENTL